MEFWDFFHAHPFIAWCALWLGWAVLFFAEIIYRILNRILRTIKVVVRGWPPEHLDADGDFRPQPPEPQP